jgi:hypothetical protein
MQSLGLSSSSSSSRPGSKKASAPAVSDFLPPPTAPPSISSSDHDSGESAGIAKFGLRKTGANATANTNAHVPGSNVEKNMDEAAATFLTNSNNHANAKSYDYDGDVGVVYAAPEDSAVAAPPVKAGSVFDNGASAGIAKFGLKKTVATPAAVPKGDDNA